MDKNYQESINKTIFNDLRGHFVELYCACLLAFRPPATLDCYLFSIGPGASSSGGGEVLLGWNIYDGIPSNHPHWVISIQNTNMAYFPIDHQPIHKFCLRVILISLTIKSRVPEKSASFPPKPSCVKGGLTDASSRISQRRHEFYPSKRWSSQYGYFPVHIGVCGRGTPW